MNIELMGCLLIDIFGFVVLGFFFHLRADLGFWSKLAE